MGGCIKRQHHDDSVIRHGQEVVITSLTLSDLSEILNVCSDCPSEETDIPTTAHRHSAPYWEQEVSHLVKLDYHFHELVVLYTVLTATTCFFPDCSTPRRARVHQGSIFRVVLSSPGKQYKHTSISQCGCGGVWESSRGFGWLMVKNVDNA